MGTGTGTAAAAAAVGLSKEEKRLDLDSLFNLQHPIEYSYQPPDFTSMLNDHKLSRIR